MAGKYSSMIKENQSLFKDELALYALRHFMMAHKYYNDYRKRYHALNKLRDESMGYRERLVAEIDWLQVKRSKAIENQKAKAKRKRKERKYRQP